MVVPSDSGCSEDGGDGKGNDNDNTLAAVVVVRYGHG